MKKKVCIYNLGGVNKELLSKKINYWQEKGLSVTIIYPSFEKEKIEKLLKDIHFLVIPYSKKRTNKLLFMFERFKRAIITCYFIPQMLKTNQLYSISSVLDAILLPFCLKIVKPSLTWTVLYENHVKLEGQGNFVIRLLAFIFHQISRVLITKADKIFVISPQLEKDLLNAGYSSEKLVVTGNAVDSQAIKKTISKHKLIYDALFMGRIDPQKGVFDLVKITRSIVKKFPGFKLIIAGKGLKNVEDKLKDRVKKSNLKNNIKMVGFISGQRKYKLLANSKLFIFPSYKESFGVALLEAVCSGTKAIAYDLPAYSSIYKNDEIIRVKKGNVDQLAQKTIKILESGTFINHKGLKLLNSNRFSYQRISQIELENFFVD